MRPDDGARRQLFFGVFFDCNGAFGGKRIVFFADMLYRKALSKTADFGFSCKSLAQKLGHRERYLLERKETNGQPYPVTSLLRRQRRVRTPFFGKIKKTAAFFSTFGKDIW